MYDEIIYYSSCLISLRQMIFNNIVASCNISSPTEVEEAAMDECGQNFGQLLRKLILPLAPAILKPIIFLELSRVNTRQPHTM